MYPPILIDVCKVTMIRPVKPGCSFLIHSPCSLFLSWIHSILRSLLFLFSALHQPQTDNTLIHVSELRNTQCQVKSDASRGYTFYSIIFIPSGTFGGRTRTGTSNKDRQNRNQVHIQKTYPLIYPYSTTLNHYRQS